MAKRSQASTRENARALMEVAGAGAAGFADTFLSGVSVRLRTEADALLQTLEDRVIIMRDRFMLGTYAAILFGVATVFITVALLLYLVQAGVSWATSFLIGGAILLIAGLVFYYRQR